MPWSCRMSRARLSRRARAWRWSRPTICWRRCAASDRASWSTPTHGATGDAVDRKEQRMRLVIGGDHAGFPLKGAVKDFLQAQGHTVEDVGTHSAEPVDFPDIARLV